MPSSLLKAPMLIKAFYGERNPKFIFLLRHPIHRIYSDFYGCVGLREVG
jgi:hypothetical protein